MPPSAPADYRAALRRAASRSDGPGCRSALTARCKLREASAASDLTIVLSTSICRVPAAAQVARTVRCLRSMRAHDALARCRCLVVFDCLPTPEEIVELTANDMGKWAKAWMDPAQCADYRAYCAALQALAAQGKLGAHTELVFLESFQHLVGTVRRGVALATTKYALVTQHDLVLAPPCRLRLGAVLPALQKGAAKYVLLGRDAARSVRTRSHFHFEPDLDRALPGGSTKDRLTAVVGFSDQTHFVDLKWYAKAVLATVPAGARTCMEHHTHKAMKDAYGQGGPHQGTYLLGGMDDDPAVRDVVHGALASDDAWLALPAPESEWMHYVNGDGAHALVAGRAQHDATDGLGMVGAGEKVGAWERRTLWAS